MAAKITDVRAYPLKTRTALVRVSTDTGVDGIGECSPMNVPVMCHFVETALRPIVLGRDALDTERLWDAMYFGTHKLGTGGVQPSCIAGVDIALWDIKGKLLGQPIYRLLGGAVRTAFTMYKSIGGGGAKALAETWDLPVMPHMTQPTIGNAATLHLCATISLSSRPHEYTGPRADLDRLFADPWELRDGAMSIPDRPGLGLTIDPRGLESARES